MIFGSHSPYLTHIMLVFNERFLMEPGPFQIELRTVDFSDLLLEIRFNIHFQLQKQSNEVLHVFISLKLSFLCNKLKLLKCRPLIALQLAPLQQEEFHFKASAYNLKFILSN